MKSIHTDSIPNGTKLVAIYQDGSGAALFAVTRDGHLLDSDGEDVSAAPNCHLDDCGYGWWLPLLPTIKLWFEHA